MKTVLQKWIFDLKRKKKMILSILIDCLNKYSFKSPLNIPFTLTCLTEFSKAKVLHLTCICVQCDGYFLEKSIKKWLSQNFSVCEIFEYKWMELNHSTTVTQKSNFLYLTRSTSWSTTHCEYCRGKLFFKLLKMTKIKK